MLAQFEESNQGIFLAGNYRGGISVGDCVKNAYEIARAFIREYSHDIRHYLMFSSKGFSMKKNIALFVLFVVL